MSWVLGFVRACEKIITKYDTKMKCFAFAIYELNVIKIEINADLRIKNHQPQIQETDFLRWIVSFLFRTCKCRIKCDSNMESWILLNNIKSIEKNLLRAGEIGRKWENKFRYVSV